MPAISKIRLTNVIYEEGSKRYNDEVFMFDGHNGAILLENGGGKTVLIQTALQAIIPHTSLAGRKIKSTLLLENSPAHIAIEWIVNDQPRRYVVTAVTLFVTKNALDSLRYVYEYDASDHNSIEDIPFVRTGKDGKRVADRGEMQDYYAAMREKSFHAKTFASNKDYRSFLETQYHIIAEEWENIVKINSTEGGVEAFFDECKYTNQLFDRLLIPIVESSIAGHESELFVDMFEKQHSSFQQYKKLKETIEENKRIQDKLEGYVGKFAQLHQSMEVYHQTKQRAKGTWGHIASEKQQMHNQQEEILKKLESWKHAEKTCEIKKASHSIAVEQLHLQQLTKDYEEKHAQLIQIEEQLINYERNFYSLRLADYQQEKQISEQNLQSYRRELVVLEEEQSFQELNDQLDQAKSALLGCILEQMEQIDSQIRELTFERNPIARQLEQYVQDLNHLLQQETDRQSTASSIEGRITTRSNDMQQIEKQLLGNPEQELIQEEFPRWNMRIQFLDEEGIRLQQEINQLEWQQQQAQSDMKVSERQKAAKEQEQGRLDTKFELIGQQQAQLIEKLAKVRPQWANLDNIYEHERTIDSRLTETIEKLSKDRNQLLHQERLAFRFVDDHGNQDVFFGDAYVSDQLHAWKQQFDFVRTGIEYIQSLEEATEDFQRIANYPLWGLTLITTNRTKLRLQERVAKVSDRLQYPIQIISTEEATDIYKDESNRSWITPSHWIGSQRRKYFQAWQEKVAEAAKNRRQLREEKEQEMKMWETALTAFQQYIVQYPYEEIKQLKEEQSNLQSEIEQCTRNIQKQQQQIDHMTDKRNQLGINIKEFEAEKQGLERKVEKARDYLRYKQEVDDDQRILQQEKNQLSLLKRDIQRKQRYIKDCEEQIKELDNRIRDLKLQSKMEKDDPSYQAIKDMTPQYTGEHRQTIQNRIYNTELRVRQIHISYSEWKTKIDHAEKTINKITADIDSLQRERKELSLDEERQFPPDGKQLMDNLWQKIDDLKLQIDVFEKTKDAAFSAKGKQEIQWKAKMVSFEQRYPQTTIITFTIPLEDVSRQLQQEQLALEEQSKYLEQEQKRCKHELNDIVEAERILYGFVEAHHFNAPDVEAMKMGVDEIRDFTYNRQRFVTEITDALKKAQIIVQNEQQKVEGGKQSFIQFCQTISDIKMRQMAVTGIEHKKTYDDLVQFKRNMMVTVERATNYANEHIRKKDAELQAFINQIHTHLQTITEELRQIPKKTKVRIEDDWKMIYHFQIPEWDEQDGQSRIRNHIEWILQQLDSDRYLNQTGTDFDNEKVRKDIETWLQTKQLLHVVMNNEGMKVSCRKVTNDNKVSKKLFSWEQSNIWSGGEKWSKNMTLFLGILNYVAEKKQHIQPNMKRHRSVILDNPFGKASSDHVLNPVFFVAEQLGFQIIALTAHTEGKFLQDHFPVLYSCRLREAADPTKQIMTKEKWLHYAYFQDHEPKSLDRLGETEQIDMFSILTS